MKDEQALPTESDGAGPDVEIEASASARELRALERPRVELSVKGSRTLSRTAYPDDRHQRDG